MLLAHATLVRGAAFLGSGLQPNGGDPVAIGGTLATKVVGNGLRELDRFLNLLVDEVAVLAAGDIIDTVAFARRRNTAGKIAMIRRSMGLPHPDHERLRAMGRTRDCLFHCGGVVRRASYAGTRTMIAGWPPGTAAAKAPGLVLQLGDRLEVTPLDLARACQFYHDIADTIVADTKIFIGWIEFPASSGYIGNAIVACDGL
ncbi:hypothetical protein [Sphingomonas sp. DBB INV C78]|uniref:hypothetical protein n=1 Tax=Sphingomonas sp. DBB INV C78 TaxID=3349434 RepID=UPI0036D3DC7A